MDNAAEKKNQQVKPINLKADRIIFMITMILAVICLALTLYISLGDKSPNRVLIAVVLFCVFSICSLFSYIKMHSDEQNKREKESADMAMALQAMFELTRKVQNESEAKINQMNDDYAVPAEEIVNAIKALAKITIGRSKENADAQMNSNSVISSQLSDMKTEVDKLVEYINDHKPTKPLTQTSSADSDTIRKLSNSVDDVLHKLKRMDADIERLEQSQKALVEKPPVIIAGSVMSGNVSALSSSVQNDESVSDNTPEEQADDDINLSDDLGLDETNDTDGLSLDDTSDTDDLSMEEENNEDDLSLDEETDGDDLSLDDTQDIDELSLDDTSEPDELTLDDSAKTDDITADDLSLEETPDTDELSLDDIPEDDGLSLDDIPEDTEEQPEKAEEDVINPDGTEAEEDVTPDQVIDEDTEEEKASDVQTESEPKEEVTEPVPQPVPQVTPISNDPNAKLSPEDIAKLFASANENDSSQDAIEDTAAPDETSATADSSTANADPNRMMTPEEIEALFSKV